MNEDKVQYLLDIAAIQALKARYCEALDTLNDAETLTARLSEICTEDCVAEIGRGPMPNLQALVTYLASAAAHAELRWHGLSTPHIIVQGDAATASWALTARTRAKGADNVTVSFGRYIDDLRRTAEGWRLIKIRMERYGVGETIKPLTAQRTGT